MSRTIRLMLACVGLILASAPMMRADRAQSARQQLSADAGWKFVLGDPANAQAAAFDDSGWRKVDLPHDWSIEGKPDKANASGPGEGFFPGGIGWYRRSFNAPRDWKGKRVSIEFDGVYRDSTVYLNGQKLGTHPNGYTSFAYDLTPSLKVGKRNVLAVRVDNSAQPNSRWYSGSGIYRHVRVVVTSPVHVAHWGVYVTTVNATTESAKLALRTHVSDDSNKGQTVEVETDILDLSGKTVGTARSQLSTPAGGEADAAQEIEVAHPALWSPDSPTLYRAVSVVRVGNREADRVETTFGIRTLMWSAEDGFLLNGQAIKLHGGSVHHDNGPLGAEAFDRADERRVELLKAAGMNAVRTAHNPPSPAFLDACDRIGLLVLDEPFDVWKAHKVKFDYGSDFDAWWKQDVSSMILRDRNHPSVVIWGIGNEIPELELESGRAIGKQLVDEVRALDSTRPVTLAFPGSTTAPNAAAVFSMLDITGYNYNLVPNYEGDHRKLPERLMLTTESLPSDAFKQWRAAQGNPYVLGEFVWTAMDYLGESGIGAWSVASPEQAGKAEKAGAVLNDPAFVDHLFTGIANGKDMMEAAMPPPGTKTDLSALMALFHTYPWHSAICGDMDLTGYRKPLSYYRDILWNGGDRVYATVREPAPEGKSIVAIGWATYPSMPSWTWPGEEGKELQVEVYSGAEKVRLYLNDKLIGEKPTGRDQEFKAFFSVPYEPGTLKALGIRGDREVSESVLTTAGPAAKLRIAADRTTVNADGEDLSFVTIEAVDADGRLVPQGAQEVQFAIDGPGEIAAVGNGDGASTESYHDDHRALYQGRALAVIRTTRAAGTIRLTAKAEGLGAAVVDVHSKAATPAAELPR